MGSAFGRGLKPPPPDLSRFSLTPEITFDIITNGYTGTVMQPFRNLPEAVRWGLVAKVLEFRKGS